VAYSGTAQIFEYPLLSPEPVKLYKLQIWQVHSFTGPSEQKHITNLREKGAWAYTGTAQIF